MNPLEASLIIADSEKDTNLFYISRFMAPDPFAFVGVDGKKVLILSDLEIDRARKESCADEFVSSSKMLAQLRRQGLSQPSLVDIVESFLKERHVDRLLVPGNFSIEYADALRERGFRITLKKEPFFEERLVKTESEIKAIRETQTMAEAALDQAIKVIAASEIRGDFLYYENQPLTSEQVKAVLHTQLIHRDCVAQRTIVSCGEDSVDPHDEGAGPLRAHQPIVIDVFPRSNQTRYYSDMTRTVVRGKASPKVRKMYEAVIRAQQIVFETLCNGADGSLIHQSVLDYFKSEGFESGPKDGRFQGFFHGTGHGVGLDLHEPPRISKDSYILKTGEVVTVEPGLYYLDSGGVRVEDMVAITETGCRNLTSFPKFLEC